MNVETVKRLLMLFQRYSACNFIPAEVYCPVRAH